jgi:hypothetical protein
MRFSFSRLQMFSLPIFLFVFLLGGTSAALGQSTSTGTVVGRVTDSTGAAVVGAVITLTDLSTNETHTEKTTKTGEYVAVNLRPGEYRITATKSGFTVAAITSETVNVGSQSNANFKLAVGSESVTVEVSESNSDLQTLNATVGVTVGQTQIENLPALGRDMSTFLTLQPGVSPEGSVAGTVVDQASFQLDGGNNSSDMDGSMTVYTGSFAGDPTGGITGAGASGVMPTPVDSVEEFKSSTANQTADFNNSSGAQVQIITRRGKDKIYATGYIFYLDNKDNANTWQNNYTSTPIADYHYSRFGLAAGGPIVPKPLLGGKTYFFANYEGYRFPNSETYERAVPSANMRNGILTFSGTNYNLKTIDPRGIGINADVQSVWNKYEPIGNDPGCSGISGTACDGVNQIGYRANLSLPKRSDFAVTRLDHDFGQKWHFMASYRYFRLTNTTDSQVDIGGALAGTKGVPTALSTHPQFPWFFVTQLTTTITSRMSNDFHYSYLRNLWSWSDDNAPTQVAGLGGALEPGGETASTVLAPYNVNSQGIRTRIWDGHDNFLSDNVTYLKGSHLIQFGGQYQHNFNFHNRTDNGGGINYTTTYELGSSGGSGANSYTFPGLQSKGYPTSTDANRSAAEVLGIVTASQVAYTRAGSNLALNPPLTPASDKVTIPYYNVFFTDSWHLKPSLTVTYGMGWSLEMPPTEQSGKQVVVVNAANEPISTLDYINQRRVAALQGSVYNPEVGFSLVHNVGAGDKYPYNPFYGEFSPRVAVAWNPKFGSEGILGKMFGGNSTVIRGGYGRIYGRLNGVDLVLVPLLGVGLIQPVQCNAALATGTCGSSAPTDTTAFRIGTDGTSAPLQVATPTLPQPLYPGYNSGATSAAEGLDPNFRPNVVDSFDLTIQRQINNKNLLEIGYIGRLIHHEYQPYNLNAVPYMTTLGGQSFASAYANLEKALGCATSAAQCGAAGTPTVAAQPFFEAALGGATSAYCKGYANCTTAVMANEGPAGSGNLTVQDVWHLWSDLDNGSFIFPRSMMNTPIPGQANGTQGQATSGIALNASTGYGNYHGGFVTYKVSAYHGLTLQENFTYSKALGTGAEVQADSEYTPNDIFNLNAMYGRQYYDHKFIFNTFLVYETPWYKKQEGILGRVLGGYTIAPSFVAGSGAPLYCNTNTDSSSFGEGDGNNYFSNEQCVFTSKYTGGVSTHRGVAGSLDPYGNDVGDATEGTGSAAINMFQNPAKVFDQVRAPILGIDTKNPGQGPISGLPYWNMDVQLSKAIRVASRAEVQLTFVSTNVLNHLVFANTSLALNYTDGWGVINAQGNNPRQMQFGGRVRF